MEVAKGILQVKESIQPERPIRKKANKEAGDRGEGE